MPFTVEPLPDEPIITTTLTDDFDFSRELDDYIKALHEILDRMPGPSICLTDARNISISFGALTGVLRTMTFGKLALLRHPHFCGAVVVTHSQLIAMGTRALGQVQYGSLKAMVASTMEGGLEMARREMEMQMQT